MLHIFHFNSSPWASCISTFLRNKGTVSLVLNYLLQDVCIANSIGREGQCLAPEQRAGRVTVYYNEDNLSRGKVQVD